MMRLMLLAVACQLVESGSRFNCPICKQETDRRERNKGALAIEQMKETDDCRTTSNLT